MASNHPPSLTMPAPTLIPDLPPDLPPPSLSLSLSLDHAYEKDELIEWTYLKDEELAANEHPDAVAPSAPAVTDADWALQDDIRVLCKR